MAYQTLNIIGTLTMGVPAVQREIGNDVQRAEAYRALMNERMKQHDQTSPDDVVPIETDSNVAISDAPEERRVPFVAAKMPRRHVQNPEPEDSESNPPTDKLDVVV